MTEGEGGPDAAEVQAAVTSVGSVTGLIGGVAGASTYLPGRRVDGIRITPTEVEIHIAAGFEEPLPSVAEQVRARVRPLVGARVVSVFIDDVRAPSPRVLTGNGTT